MRTDVVAYIDWNTQISNAGARSIADPIRRAAKTLQFVQEGVAKLLNEFDRSRYYLVQMRLYHGWHRGFTPTPNKTGLDSLLAGGGLNRTLDRVSFGGGISYGYNLVGVGAHRRCRNIHIHLPDTERESLDRRITDPREKMVDTALACDVLTSARSDAPDWRLIISDDDDCVPVAFLSEAWAKHQAGRTYLVRSVPPSRFLATDGLVWQMR